MTLPAKFVERVLCDLGEAEGRALCAALDGVPPVSVRINPAKAAADALSALEIAGQVPWCRDGRYLAVRPSFTLDPDFHAGAYYVQEASSQFVGHLLEGVRTEGARILDLCAAPGGKTTLYASLAGPGGLVVANEIDRRRAAVLADNVRKWGTGNVAVTTCEPRMLGDFEAWFDIVAVDAPCSGEGMFRKEEAAVTDWTEDTNAICANRQLEILTSAAAMLRPGGRLVYSTCTFSPVENEGVISDFLWKNPDFSVEKPDVPLFSPGRPDWVANPAPGLEKTFRLWPHKLLGEGHYAAVLRRAGDEAPAVLPPEPAAKCPPELAAFRGQTGAALPEGKLLRFGDVCYLVPQALPEVKGLRVLRAGLELGAVLKNRFAPAHAWALWLETLESSVSLEESDPLLARYLSGDVLPSDKRGWTLVQADGLSLGWAKGDGSQLKNHYPKALRRPV